MLEFTAKESLVCGPIMYPRMHNQVTGVAIKKTFRGERKRLLESGIGCWKKESALRPYIQRSPGNIEEALMKIAAARWQMKLMMCRFKS